MCHALVIEDEFLIADYVAELAEQAGATSVDFAETERDAICAARGRRPDIILSDVHLLKGTGPSAVCAIQEEHGEVPVIFITSAPEDCRPCGEEFAILSKPVLPELFSREFLRLAPVHS